MRLFLEGIEPAIGERLGEDSLLYRRVKSSLKRGDLASLRDARQMFNHQDIALKRQLSLAVGARPATTSTQATSGVVLAEHHDPSDGWGLRAEASDGTAPSADRLYVHVPDGSLPTDIANRLRRMADAIDRDRRLVSPRHHNLSDREPGA